MSRAWQLAMTMLLLVCAVGCGKNRLWQSREPLFSGRAGAAGAEASVATGGASDFQPPVIDIPDVSAAPRASTSAPSASVASPRNNPAPVVVDDARFAELQRRATDLERNNEDLHRQLAVASQQSQALKDQVSLIQNKLNETVTQLRDTQLARDEADRRAQAVLASTRKQGTRLTPNNTIKRKLEVVQLPGFDVRQDGDTIRIAIPADQLFRPASVEWVAGANTLLEQVATAVAQNYPRQQVTIEGHSDSSVIGLPAGSQQLSASQAVAVYQFLTARNLLPAKQLITMGVGPNYPRASNATAEGRSQNRRVELVIYPKEVDPR